MMFKHHCAQSQAVAQSYQYLFPDVKLLLCQKSVLSENK